MIKPVYVLLLCVMLMCGVPCGTLYAGEKWPGVDEAVINRIAREHGREEKPSLIPAAEGDLQLFMFLLAGAVGGFAAGYYWRVLLERRTEENKPATETGDHEGNQPSSK